ncbi:MAG TPA: DNA recombination protein RmuC [Bacteroidales bacterium]|nr:DNA recombination protein RmuC [Bacteroidales bacterium]
MEITTIFIILTFLLLVVTVILLIRLSGKKEDTNFSIYFDQQTSLLNRIEGSLRDEFARSREESQRNMRESREETQKTITNFSEVITKTMTEIGKLQKEQLEGFAAQLKNFQEQQALSDKSNREELKNSLKSFEDKFSLNVRDFNDLQRQKLDQMLQQLEKIRETMENRLKLLQDENSKKLDEMRATVDEKLQDTLEKRLTESFKQVSERLEQVHKGLGEMQTLATGVGDLKKVLSNVKTRGILGEIQLGNILEQILSPEQYATNVATKKETRENVEFAVKLPGKDDFGQVVWLPIDSKFPLEDYHALIEAYENGDASQVTSSAKLLENSIKKFAKDIRDKYIDPPYTTDFGIMFLPVEGLYAEVIRRTNLVETLQRDYKIVITGPTTLAAILNSLQMGFRTLAIEKRSSEVWKILGAVKTEFGRFGDVLKKAQEKIMKAGEDIDELVGTRTRKIQSKLKQVQELPSAESSLMLGENDNAADDMD